MKLQQLEVLLSVVEHGGIRAAGRELHLSQAAVTKSMRQLEEQAGVSLLVRGARGVTLTTAGERLITRARMISRQVALAREDLRQAAGEDVGSVRVGVTPYLTLTALGPAFEWFRRRYQRVQVQVSEGLMARVLPRLRDGSLDMAAVAADVGEVKEDEFRCLRLATAPQRIVVRAGHPVLSAVSAQALVDCEWVVTQPPGGGRRVRLEAMFALAGVAPPERVIVAETLAALAILRHSDAVGVIPAPLLDQPECRGIVAVPDAPLHPSDIELLLLTPRDVPVTPAAEYFAHCLASVATAGTS